MDERNATFWRKLESMFLGNSGYLKLVEILSLPVQVCHLKLKQKFKSSAVLFMFAKYICLNFNKYEFVLSITKTVTKIVFNIWISRKLVSISHNFIRFFIFENLQRFADSINQKRELVYKESILKRIRKFCSKQIIIKP